MSNTFGFDGFVNALDDIINNYETEAKDFIRNIEMEVVANTQLNTPVVTGNLKRSWTFEEPEKQGNAIVGEVGSDVPYAEAIEFGHSTSKGGWVAGQFILTTQVGKINDQFEQRAVDFLNTFTNGVSL